MHKTTNVYTKEGKKKRKRKASEQEAKSRRGMEWVFVYMYIYVGLQMGRAGEIFLKRYVHLYAK